VMEAYLEDVNDDNCKAYAWLAIGRFYPPVVAVPEVDPSQFAKREETAADLAGQLALTNLQPQLARLLGNPSSELDTRFAAARALVSFCPNEQLAALATLIPEPAVSS